MADGTISLDVDEVLFYNHKGVDGEAFGKYLESKIGDGVLANLAKDVSIPQFSLSSSGDAQTAKTMVDFNDLYDEFEKICKKKLKDRYFLFSSYYKKN